LQKERLQRNRVTIAKYSLCLVNAEVSRELGEDGGVKNTGDCGKGMLLGAMLLEELVLELYY
jgi:hypothetical protein